MWKEYAETPGKSVNDLTLAEKRQALNGIMHETSSTRCGEHAEFAGRKPRTRQRFKASQALGSSMACAIGDI